MRRDKPAVGAVVVSAMTIGLGAGFVNLIAYLTPVIRADLHISRGAIGAVASCYFGAAGLGSIAAGRLADRVGARWSIVIQLLAVATGAAAVALTGEAVFLAVAALGVGFGYAVANAGTNIAVSHAVSPGRRGIALTLKTAGGPLFAATAALVVGSEGEALGWRPLMAALAVLALLVAGGAYRVLSDDRPSARPVRGRGVLPPGFLWFPVAAFFFVTGAQPLFQWIVPYLQEGVGASAQVAGVITSVSIVTGVVGMVFAALRSDRLGVGNRVVLLVVAAVTCMLGEGLLVLGRYGGLALAATGALIGTAGLLGGLGVLQASIVDVAPHAVGRASGVTFTGYYVGALVAPVGFGTITDATSSYSTAWLVAIGFVGVSALVYTRCAAIAVPHAAPRSPRLAPGGPSVASSIDGPQG